MDRVDSALIWGLIFGCRGGGEPAVRLSAAGEGVAVARLRCRSRRTAGCARAALSPARSGAVTLFFSLCFPFPFVFMFHDSALG